jgi:probable phosphoglycerate mutase
VETAEAVAKPHELVPRLRDDLGEFRFGQWEGMSLQDLDKDPEWARFNASRSSVRAPGGELMIETQTRMVSEIESLQSEHEGETIVVVSHGDPLRSLVAHFLGMSLDSLLRFEISPASVTVLETSEAGGRIFCVNYTGELPV